VRQKTNRLTLYGRMCMIRRIIIKRKIGMGMRDCSPIKMVRMIKHGRRDVITQKEHYKHPFTDIYQFALHISSLIGTKLMI